MSTTRNPDFQTMLNQYLPNSLLKEEFVKRDYFLNQVEKDDTWLGGELVVPFRGATASTVKLGGLASEAEINQSKYVRGIISSQPEIWGSLVFNERDISEHGKINEQNLLKILPDEIDNMMTFMKQAVSMQFTNGAVLATATSNGTVGGEINVDRIERFEVGQPLVIDDNNSPALKVYIKEVHVDDSKVIACTDIGLTTLADLSPYTTAQNAVFYFDGGETSGNRFSNLKSMLLSAANGGASTLYGQNKLLYPYLQSINVSGASITAANILEKLFDAQTVVRNKGKGLPDKAVMSYKHLGSILKALEATKGAYRMADSKNAQQFYWTEVEIFGVKGKLSIVAIQEMDDDAIFLLDMAALKIYSNGFFKKRKNPSNGNEFYEIRSTSGYKYIVDICFFGDMVLERPSRCGIIHSISY
jgi:hypothetical protein